MSDEAGSGYDARMAGEAGSGYDARMAEYAEEAGSGYDASAPSIFRVEILSHSYGVLLDEYNEIVSKIAASDADENVLMVKAQEKGLFEECVTVTPKLQSKKQKAEYLVTQVLKAVRKDEKKINVFLKLLEENSLGNTAMYLTNKLQQYTYKYDNGPDLGFGVSEDPFWKVKEIENLKTTENEEMVHNSTTTVCQETWPYSGPYFEIHEDIHPHLEGMNIAHERSFNEPHSEELHEDTQLHLEEMLLVHPYQETQPHSKGILPGLKIVVIDQLIERVGREKTTSPSPRTKNPPKIQISRKKSRRKRKQKEKSRLKKAKLENEANKRKLLEVMKQLEKKDLQIQELEERMMGDLEHAKMTNTALKEKYESQIRLTTDLQARIEKQNAEMQPEQNFLREVSSDVDAESDQHLKRRRVKLHVLAEFFVLMLLFMVAPGHVLIGCLSALVLGITPENLLMYVASAVFAFQISPKELFIASVTMTLFVGSLLCTVHVLKYVYTLVTAKNRTHKKAKSMPGRQLKWSGITASTIRLLAIVYVASALQWGIGWDAAEKTASQLSSMTFSSTFVRLLPCILLAILTDVIHISFKTCWCILAVYCSVEWLVSLKITPVIELRAALVICLITCTILQYMQEGFYQDVITVKNCSVFKYVGNELSFLWRDYGIELHIPATNAPIDDDIEVIVQVRAPDENFQIPKGYELVSAIYSISTSHPLPVEAVLRLQHCAPGHMVTSRRLCFVHSHNGPPYEFQQMKGAKFSQYSCYGEIKVSEFSDYGIVGEEHIPPDLLVGVYSYGTMAHFVVTRNLPAHRRAVEDELNSKTDKLITVESDENLEEIELNIPTESKGWEVTSTFTPAVLSMKVVCGYQPGKAATIPKIILEMEWLCSSEPAKPTDVIIHVKGLEKLKAFKLPCGRRSAIQIPPTPSCLTRLLHTLKYKIKYSQFSGKLDIDRDFIRVCELLSNLKKEELRAVGRRLGLSNNTVNNYYDNSVNSYCEEILTAWMNERDNVLSNGGATWENLKKALESEGLTGHAAQIQ